jgi:hypothetical protein
VRLLLDPGSAAQQGEPVLDPRRWTARHRWAVGAGLLVALAAGLVEAAQHDAHSSATEGLRAFLAAGFGVGLILLALSLRGITLPGFLIGALFVTAGMLSWAYTDTPVVVWLLLLVEGGLFLVWTFRWLRELTGLPRLGAAWLGLGYWVLGAIGAILVWHPKVAVQRLAYLGLFTLGALAVLVVTRKSRRDLTIGITAAFLCALGVLLLIGSGNALDAVHAVPPNAWGRHMEYRFWGGPGLLYHPNSIALVVVLIAVRIGADPAFERWQRYAALGVPAVLLPLVSSRTGVLYLAVAAGLHALLVWRRRTPDRYPSARAAWVGALGPLLLVGVIILASGGIGFLKAERYDNGGDVTSGRTATWAQVWREFRADDVAQQLFGNAQNARATVSRPDAAANPADLPKLTTDNALVGALRRGGVLGVLAFLLGCGLLVWHAVRGAGTGAARRRPATWFQLAVVGSLITIPTADWLLGGTGGTMWIYLLAGEAVLLSPPGGQPPSRG